MFMKFFNTRPVQKKDHISDKVGNEALSSDVVWALFNAVPIFKRLINILYITFDSSPISSEKFLMIYFFAIKYLIVPYFHGIKHIVLNIFFNVLNEFFFLIELRKSSPAKNARSIFAKL